MKSEVEINKALITINDVLYYMDDANSEKYIVTEVDGKEFTAMNVETEKIEFFEFSTLQPGWSISDKTKNKHALERRFVYQ